MIRLLSKHVMLFGLSIGIIALAIILGIKHSLDADHVVAISSILLRAPTLRKSMKLSTTWALGHMVTASIITLIIFTFKEFIITKLLANFEPIVAVMLIAIAILTFLWEFDVISWGKHTHGHKHPDGEIHFNHDESATDVNKADVSKADVNTTDVSKADVNTADVNTADGETGDSEDLSHSHITFSGAHEYKAMGGIGLVHGLASNDELLTILVVTLALDSYWVMLVIVFIFTLGVIGGMLLYSTVLKYPMDKFGHERVLKIVNLTIAVITLIYGFYILFGGDTLNPLNGLNLTP